MIILIFVCVAMAMAISSAVRFLAMKYNTIANRRHWQVIVPGVWNHLDGYSHLASKQRIGSGKHRP